MTGTVTESFPSISHSFFFFFLLSRRREYIQQEDLTKAARKVADAKKHESKQPTSPKRFCNGEPHFSDFYCHSQTRCISIDILLFLLPSFLFPRTVIIDDIVSLHSALVRVRTATTTLTS